MHKILRRVRRDQKGFTLIELMVVVAIIGLLAAFAVPRLWQAINDAKAAPGKADLNTIGAALERHYFAGSSYPGSGDTLQATLVPTYLKTTTTFVNGYGRGFVYGTNTNGDGYILIDPGNADTATAVNITCGTGAGATTHPFTPSNTVQVIDLAGVTNPSTCTAPAGMRYVVN